MINEMTISDSFTNIDVSGSYDLLYAYFLVSFPHNEIYTESQKGNGLYIS